MQARDLSHPMGLLLGAVAGMRGIYGAGKPVMLLRGNNNKDMKAWLEVRRRRRWSLKPLGKLSFENMCGYFFRDSDTSRFRHTCRCCVLTSLAWQSRAAQTRRRWRQL